MLPTVGALSGETTPTKGLCSESLYRYWLRNGPFLGQLPVLPGYPPAVMNICSSRAWPEALPHVLCLKPSTRDIQDDVRFALR